MESMSYLYSQITINSKDNHPRYNANQSIVPTGLHNSLQHFHTTSPYVAHVKFTLNIIQLYIYIYIYRYTHSYEVTHKIKVLVSEEFTHLNLLNFPRKMPMSQVDSKECVMSPKLVLWIQSSIRAPPMTILFLYHNLIRIKTIDMQLRTF